MDEPGPDATGPDVAQDVIALLRGLTDRQLTPAQSADLDAVLGELDLVLRNGVADRSELAWANGDLRILDSTTVAVEPGSAGALVGPLTRGQRDRIKRLVPVLTPARRRVLVRWRRP